MNTNEKTAFIVRLSAIGVLLVVVALVLCAHTGKQYRVAEWHSYTIVEGDTLYGIAQRVTPNSVDWRTTVDKIQKENGITPTIYPGQVIAVPVWRVAE